MVIPPLLNWRFVVPGFALLLSAPAGAQPGQGSMGEQSRASIRISVSVMPRFSLGQGSSAPAPLKTASNAGRDTLQVFSNTRDLRIHLVGAARTPTPGEARLFLIAAD